MLKIFAPIASVVALAACQPDPKENCENTQSAKIGAYFASQYFVERRLKSPQTADFPIYGREGVEAVHLGGCKFAVRGYVDAQNSFGASIRHHYMMDIEADPVDGGYYGRSLTFF